MRHFALSDMVNEPLSLAISHRGNRDRHGTRNTTPGTRGAPARALPAPFSRSRPVCPRHDTPCLPSRSSLPSFPPLLRSNSRSPLALARATGVSRRGRGGTFGSIPLPSCRPPPPPPPLSVPHPPTLLHTHAHSRESIIVQNRELSYYAI